MRSLLVITAVLVISSACKPSDSARDGGTSPLRTAAAGSPDIVRSPGPFGFGDPNPPVGWCARPASLTISLSRSFELSNDRSAAVPIPRAGSSEQIASWRQPSPARMSMSLRADIVGDELRVSTHATSCEDTSSGCFAGYWVNPSRVVAAAAVPLGSCIAYAMQLSSGIIVGTGAHLYAFRFDGVGRVVALPPIATPSLEALDVFEDAHGRSGVLQEHDGPLWVARWNRASEPPSLTRVPGVTERTLAIHDANGGLLYAVTSSALVALDLETFTPRWRMTGEVWAVMRQDVPPAHLVLVVDRRARPRLLLRELDEHGRNRHELVIYEGDDLVGAMFDQHGQREIVHVATR
ncbi:MAG: hypothetical protein H6Q90_4181 [Deltaproteobacteria bacterium]|nr:hypothetical protein [Deltaproteobacteria bacterium]